MIIERIVVHGFGRLRDLDLTFTRGLNLIHGPNESGKSTLLHAIQAMFYGQRRDGQEEHRPWQGERYSGTLHLCLGNGEKYRIERHFDERQVKVFRDPGATDITRELGGKRKVESFVEDRLGLSLPAFRASACITQGGLSLDRDDVTALHGKLEALADTAGTESTATNALRRLGDQIRDRINPNPHVVENSPLRRAEKRVGDLRGELATSRRALEALAELEVQRRQLQAQVGELSGEITSLAATMARKERDRLADQLRRLRELDQGIANADARLQALADVAHLTGRAFRDADSALENVERLRRDVDDARAQLASERETYEGAVQELARINCKLEVSPAAASAPPEAVEIAERSVHAWDAAVRAVQQEQENVDGLQRQMAALGVNDDPVLSTVAPGTTAMSLASTIEVARQAEQGLSNAARALHTFTTSSEVQAELREYDRLQQTLGGLKGPKLDELRSLEERIRLAEASRPTGAGGAALVVGAIAMVVGYLIAPTLVPGNEWLRILLAVGFGALGYVVTSGLGSSGDAGSTAVIAKNRALLDQRLARFGVSSVGELQHCWNRREELRDRLREGLELRRRLDERQGEREQAMDAIEHLVGTRDIEQAAGILRALQDRERAERDRQVLGDAVHRARQRLQEAGETASARQEESRAALGALGFAATDPQAAGKLLNWIRDCQRLRGDLLRQQTEKKAQRDAYAERERRLREQEERLAAADIAAGCCLVAVGCAAGVADRRAALAERWERFEIFEETRRKRAAHAAARKSLVGHDDPITWQRRYKELCAQVEDEGAADPRSLGELQARHAEVAEERREAERELARLDERRGQYTARHPAEVEEELATAEAALLQLKRLHQALQKTKELIAAVAAEYRRNFAPRLSSRVGAWIERVTDQRYREVEVDPKDLAVKVRSDERGGLVPLSQLSQGTRDAIHLLLRATIVDLLGAASETVPLFLDDPLVNVDPRRARRMLEVIGELSRERQFVYFTQDPRVADVVTGFANVTIHQLS